MSIPTAELGMHKIDDVIVLKILMYIGFACIHLSESFTEYLGEQLALTATIFQTCS